MIEYKSFVNQPLDIDTTGKRVKIAISKMGNEDNDRDVIVPGAANKTLKERGPSGTNQIWHLADHTPSLKYAFGKFSEMGIEKDYLWGLSTYKDNSTWREAWPLYESGDITEHSIGFSIPKNGSKKEGNIRYITEIKLYEGSSVLWGANPNTPTLFVGKSLNLAQKTDFIHREMDYLIKNCDRLDEDNISLFRIKLEQVQTLLADFTKDTNPAAQGALDPGSDDASKHIAARIKLITLSI